MNMVQPISDTSIIAVDLAKDIFQAAFATESGRVVRQERYKSRLQFGRAVAQWQGKTVVMEACATAHYWGRELLKRGCTVRLLPTQLVKPYRPRNKTDAADCLALLEAHRNQKIKPVPVKNESQQQVMTLHALREQYKTTRVAHLNALRAHFREYGFILGNALQGWAEHHEKLPIALQSPCTELKAEIGELERKVTGLERQIKALNRQNSVVGLLETLPGIGPLTASALAASAVDADYFKNGRDLSAWVGLTPREHSSGPRQWRGGISKKGDSYVRMLIIHGARSALQAAAALQQRAPERLTRLQQWALQLLERMNYNVAVVALANKMLRIAWRLWKNGECYHPQPSTQETPQQVGGVTPPASFTGIGGVKGKVHGTPTALDPAYADKRNSARTPPRAS